MAVSVTQFRRQQAPMQQSSVEQNPLARMLTIGGAVAGGVMGGLPGAAQGASMGQLAGGLIGGQPSAPEPQAPAPPMPESVQTGGDQMKRRLGEIDNSNLTQIAQSIDSLKYVQDEDLRLKMAQPLLQAYQSAERQG